MKAKTYRKYDKEFKEDTVKLVVEGGRTISSVSRDPGVAGNNLSRWVKKYQEDPEHCFPGKGRLKPHEEENICLKKKLRDVTEERDILKKAMAVFSRHVR